MQFIHVAKLLHIPYLHLQMSRGDVADACRDQVLHLLQDGLFESAEVLCHFVLSSAPWPRADREALGASFEELLADSLFAQSQFKRAAMHFQQALDLSGCGRGRPVESKDEARLIYKSALCSIELKEASCGIKLLESIPPALRNVKVCVAMGKLYAELGLKKSAIGCFRQVLSVLPSSIEAIESLGQ